VSPRARLRLRSLVALATAAAALNASTSFAAPKKPVPAAAPKPKPAAPAAPSSTKTSDEANALLRAGNFEAALALFRKITTSEGRRGAALALDKLGRSEEAIAEYEAFIAGAPASQDEDIKAVRARVAELKAPKKASVQIVTVPAGATIDVVGQPAPSGTSPVQLELPVGKHVVRATLPGSEAAEREFEVAVGSTVQVVRLDLTPSNVGVSAPAAVTALQPLSGPPQQSGVERLGAPIITGALAGLSLGAGTYFGLRALSKQSDYKDLPSGNGLAEAETAAGLSTAAFVAGALFTVVTVVLLLGNPSAVDVPSKNGAASAKGLRVRF
jgi:tetratricopeptide (TPR) repeat protein